MKTARYLAALTFVVATLVAPSLFAEKRHRDATDRGRNDRYRGSVVRLEGRIHDIDRDRNGFVIRLDGRKYVFAPARTEVRRVSYRNDRGRRGGNVRSLERGDYIEVTGRVGSRGVVNAHLITLLREEDDRSGRDDRWLRGTVESVEWGRRTIVVHDDRSGRSVRVNLREAFDDRGGVRDLRRGDRVTIRGDWRRNGVFEAERIEITDRYDRRW